MMAHPAPLADLHTALDRLEHELSGNGDLGGTSPAYFQERLRPILAALGGAVKAARTALEPALLEEAHRDEVHRAYTRSGEA